MPFGNVAVHFTGGFFFAWVKRQQTKLLLVRLRIGPKRPLAGKIKIHRIPDPLKPFVLPGKYDGAAVTLGVNILQHGCNHLPLLRFIMPALIKAGMNVRVRHAARRRHAEFRHQHRHRMVFEQIAQVSPIGIDFAGLVPERGVASLIIQEIRIVRIYVIGGENSRLKATLRLDVFHVDFDLVFVAEWFVGMFEDVGGEPVAKTQRT